MTLLEQLGARVAGRAALVLAGLGLLWSLMLIGLVTAVWALVLLASRWLVAPAAFGFVAVLALGVAGLGLVRRRAVEGTPLPEAAVAWVKDNPLEGAALALTAGVLAARGELRPLLMALGPRGPALADLLRQSATSPASVATTPGREFPPADSAL